MSARFLLHQSIHHIDCESDLRHLLSQFRVLDTIL
nr:MAG TPA: hypothetical protein [Caudoviricetes sp.]